MKKRIVFIDYLRLLAILMVIMCHVIDVNCRLWLGYVDMSLFRQLFVYIALIIGRLGVPIFLMITGYLLLDRDYSKIQLIYFYKKKVLWFFVIVELWTIIYEVYGYEILGYDYNLKVFLRRLCLLETPALSHAWYLPMILKMYVFIPVIGALLRRLTEKHIFIVLGLMFISVICFQVVDVSFINETNLSSYIAYLWFVIMGNTIKRGGLESISRKIWLLADVVLVFCEINCLFIQHNQGRQTSLWYDNPVIMILSISCFIRFKHYLLEQNKLIEKVSKYTFGIYLTHNMIALAMLKYLMASDFNFYFLFFMTYMIVAVTSYVVVLLISKTGRIGRFILYMKSEEEK